MGEAKRRRSVPDQLDVPYRRSRGAWQFVGLGDRKIVIGTDFDPVAGYRVYMMFLNGQARNLFSADTAREIGRRHMSASASTKERSIARGLREKADQVFRLQGRWHKAGRPNVPLHIQPQEAK